MSQELIIAPSILAADLACLDREIKDVEAGGANWLHLDIMDGSFVPPITFGANIVAQAKQSCKLFLDVHLMIEKPEQHFEAFKDAGSNCIVIHQETCPHLYRSLTAIKAMGIACGVALNPGTPVDSIFDVLDICDLVLIMTVNPGWGGQPFIPTCLKKIKTLKAEIEARSLSTHIQVDGGINAETSKECVAAGANVLVAGSYIFGAKDRALAIESLRS